MTEPPPCTLRFRSTARSHVGLVRDHNEDAFLDKPSARLWVVADGMGGHAHGDMASALTIQALADLPSFDSGYAYLNAVDDALQRVNAQLADRGRALGRGGIIGATVVALVVHESHAAWLWAGDSRAYRLSGGELQQMTHDHSVVQELIDAGASPELVGQANANLITRAVGAAATLELERQFAAVVPGDRFLLCSDGLALPDTDIQALLGGGRLEDCAEALLAAALARGGQDNVTLVLVEAMAAS